MPMNGTFLDSLATHGKGLITHIGLVNGAGAAVGDARKAVTWTGPTGGDGLIRPSADIVFNMTAGQDVAGWRGYSALTAGTDYGGAALTAVNFSNDGTYTLAAASTSIDINV